MSQVLPALSETLDQLGSREPLVVPEQPDCLEGLG